MSTSIPSARTRTTSSTSPSSRPRKPSALRPPAAEPRTAGCGGHAVPAAPAAPRRRAAEAGRRARRRSEMPAAAEPSSAIEPSRAEAAGAGDAGRQRQSGTEIAPANAEDRRRAGNRRWRRDGAEGTSPARRDAEARRLQPRRRRRRRAASRRKKMAAAAAEPPAEARPRRAAASGPAPAPSTRVATATACSLTFSFATATPAALFRRADTVWLVFDSTKPIDVEPIRSKGGSIIADVDPLAAGQRAGDPHSPQPPANAVADGRRSGRRRELDADLRRYDADADAAAGGDTQHHRSRARQCHGAAGQARPAASAGRSGRRRYADGGHRAAAGSRLHQAAGFRRAVAAGIDPRRRDSSELRRRHRRGRAPTRSSSAGPAA